MNPVQRQQLQALLKAIIPYLPRPVVEEHLTDPEIGRVRGEYWEGSVLFADLSGFTALSETLSKLGKEGAEIITHIVNDLFEALLEDVERYDGILLKFGGDAMTVFFDGDDHALRATRAGLAMQETMDRRFVNLDTRGGLFTLRLRVGVHTGKIFAAQVGHEPGYRLRGMELVITGAEINRVAEAQDYAAPGDVCITAETLAPIKDQAAVEPITGGMFRLQGLNLARPLETPPPPPVWSPSEDDSLARLKALVEALRPFLPVYFADERIADPSDPELHPQLRPVAVLFANFADLSAILTALDGQGQAGVQAATKILNAYYARMQDIIGRYGGVINKVDMYTHGDKLMAIFGAPLTYGDDVERAVRAALEMQAAMPQVNQYVRQVLTETGVAPLVLTQRIGLNFGHVFAGNVGSEREGSRREYTVMGDVVNLAARLMVAAERDQILISPSVRRMVADKFQLWDLPPRRVKGKTEPVPVFVPVRPLTAHERAALRRGGRPFIGRAAQLGELRKAVRRASSGAAQIVAIVGEAGTGKTRLIEAFQDELSTLSEARCVATELPSYAQEPYAPIIDLLRRLIGLGGEAAQDVNRLTAWVEDHVPHLVQFIPLLGNLLALPIADNPVTAALTPEQRHDRLDDLIEAALHNEARRRPLVIVVDDLQWGDDSSLALLDRLTAHAQGIPLMLVLCYRSDASFATPWTELPYATVVQVAEFTPQESVELVAALLETAELPTGLAEIVWEKTQGNPFFIEEYVKSLRETQALIPYEGRWQLLTSTAAETAITNIPDTIEGIVLARLDRLEARCRDVLQEAAVAAASQPRFARPLLEQVDPHPVDLPDRLHRLVSDGLLETLQSELEALEYHFRHALTRDVAYDSLLYARRRELHRLIAQGIEMLYADRLDEHVTSLAHHYREAEEWSRAFRYQRRAGERAQGLFANKNAIAYFRRALRLAEEHLPDMLAAFEPDELVHALADIHEHLGDVLVVEGRYDEALETFAAARNLLTQDSPPDIVAKFYRKTAEVYERKADFAQALDWLERGLAALGDADTVEKARIYNLRGGIHFRQGEREKALTWRQRALEIAQQLGDQSEIANAYLIMAVIYSDWGDLDRALAYGQRCLEAYEAAGDLAGSVKARLNVGIISRKADLWTQAVEHFQEGLRLSEMMNDGVRIGQFATSMGNVYLDQGKLEEAAEAYRRSIAVWEPIGLPAGVTVARINLGKVAITQGDLEAGQTYLDDAQKLAEEIGTRLFLPEIYHWQAALHLARRQFAEALELAHKAHNLAVELQDRTEEGGALRVLGRICAAMGQTAQAVAYLEASLDCFRDLKSKYQTAQTNFELARVFLDQPTQREEGRELLQLARQLFAQLGAQRDLVRVEELIEH